MEKLKPYHRCFFRTVFYTVTVSAVPNQHVRLDFFCSFAVVEYGVQCLFQDFFRGVGGLMEVVRIQEEALN